MRSTTITVHCGQLLEIFAEECAEGFELWMVGTIKGKRILLDHHLTHDDLEERLRYRDTRDLRWRDALFSEIPVEKHPNVKEMEASIKRRTFIDQTSVVAHFSFGSIDLVPTDPKILSAAKAKLPGNWSDGQVVMSLEAKSKLILSGATKESQLLNRGRGPDDPVRNWWNFDNWQLWLMNAKEKIGQRIGVLHVGDQELHLYSIQPDQMAHIFKRIK